MSKEKETKKHIVPAKKERPTPERQSNMSIDGFNLAEFSLSPLTYQTREFAHKELFYEWEQVLDGELRQCYFKISYGETPPNADTEDYLLLLFFLGQMKNTPLALETSFYEILKTKGIDYTPNKQQIHSIIRHLDALMDLKIETNFIYDRKTKKWNKGIKTGVISGYEYKSKKQRLKRLSASDTIEDIQELDTIYFDPAFYKYFVADNISFDLATYFLLENPTPKRMYRFGNKYAKNFGSFGLDLVHFCITRLGMKKSYVDGFKYISKLASKLRPHASRVNETVDELEITIQKDKKQPSGYKIYFCDNTEGEQKKASLEGFTKAEKKLYEELCKEGIYPSPARNLVVKLRTYLGRLGAAYADYTIKAFRKYEKKGLKIDKKNRGGVLLQAFNDHWYYPAFMEWHNSKEKREEAKALKNPEKNAVQQVINKKPQQTLIFPKKETPRKKPVEQNKSKTPSVEIKKTKFRLERFKELYPEIFTKIYQHQLESAKRALATFGEAIVTNNGKNTFDEGVLQRVEFYCHQCHREFEKGRSDYFPPM